MKKRKSLEQIKHYYRHYLATFSQVKRRGKPAVRRHLNKLQGEIYSLEAKPIES